MFSLGLVTKNIFFLLFEMDLPVPNSASSSVVLMWVNFLSAPRKSVFPVSPGAKENCKADKASFRAPQGLQGRQHFRGGGSKQAVLQIRQPEAVWLPEPLWPCLCWLFLCEPCPDKGWACVIV